MALRDYFSPLFHSYIISLLYLSSHTLPLSLSLPLSLLHFSSFFFPHSPSLSFSLSLSLSFSSAFFPVVSQRCCSARSGDGDSRTGHSTQVLTATWSTCLRRIGVRYVFLRYSVALIFNVQWM